MTTPLSRHRSKGGFTGVQGSYYRNETSCGSGKIFMNYNTVADVGLKKEIWDSVTPQFQRRVRRGEIIINPVKILEESQGTSGSGYTTQSTATNSPCGTHWQEILEGAYAYFNSHSFSRTLPFVELVSDSDISSLVAEATTQAWANSNGHDSDVLQDIAEWRQTVGLASVPLQTARKTLGVVKNAWRGFRKGNIAPAAKAVTEGASLAGQLWLTYRFGVRPLVRDVHSFLSSLELKPIRRRKTYRGSSLYKTSAYGETVAETWNCGFNVEDKSEEEVSIRAGILIDEVMTAQRYLGLDASGMLALPWELVPMSWAADYFTNVGDFLYGLVPYLSGDPLGSWYTIRRTYTHTWNVLGSYAIGAWTLVKGADESKWARKVLTERIPNLAAPTLVIRHGNVKASVTAVRSANLLAVALQQVARALRG